MFLCLLNIDGGPVPDVERRKYAGRLRELASTTAIATTHIEIIDAGEFVGIVAPALVPLRPLWGRHLNLVGIGNVRLDSRPGPANWHAEQVTKASDLELVLAGLESGGEQCIRDLLGDFALVVWDNRTRRLLAARDAFGVKTLFVGQRGNLLVLSSHLELVHERDVLDEEYVADFLLAGDPGPVRTIWVDSRAVSQGSILHSREGKLTSERFWNPFDFGPIAHADQRELIEAFKSLFFEAIRARVESKGQTWAELSGGLDSSSIVCTAQQMVEAGLMPAGIAGTISIVDELGGGNEQQYSDVVVQRFDLPNAKVINPWPWQDDGYGAPQTDEPRVHYPFFARDRAVCKIVRDAGARILLSGFGSDHYLYGSRLLVADLMARGKVIRACREAARWAVQEQRSFWKELRQTAVAPFFPSLNPVRVESVHTVPDWIEPGFAQRLSMSKRLPALRGSRGKRGQKFAQYISGSLQEVVRWLPRGTFEEGMELRYPFFYRPLVEFALRTPPLMRSQPLAPKWILREAMRDVLPEAIRIRSGKGTIDARLSWGFQHEQKRISAILAESRLVSSGIIRRDRLENALSQAVSGTRESITTLLAALSLETWLFARSGNWNVGKAGSRLNSCSTHQRIIQSA